MLNKLSKLNVFREGRTPAKNWDFICVVSAWTVEHYVSMNNKNEYAQILTFIAAVRNMQCFDVIG